MNLCRQAIAIVVDACPISLLGCYGNEWIETPTIDELAHSGTVYERYYPECITEQFTMKSLAAATRRIAKAGVATSTLAGNLGSDSLIDVALDWIDQHQSDPFALVLHPTIAKAAPGKTYLDIAAEVAGVEPMLMHEDFGNVDPEDDTMLPRLRAGWAARLAHLDACLGELQSTLREENLAESTWLAFTAERGVHLGEQDWIGTAVTAYDAAIHVPLLIRHPDSVGCERRHALTQSADWIADLLGFFEISVAASMPRSHVIVQPNGDRDLQRAIVTAKWKLVETPNGPELYAKPEDRFDIRDIARQHPQRVEELLELAVDADPE